MMRFTGMMTVAIVIGILQGCGGGADGSASQPPSQSELSCDIVPDITSGPTPLTVRFNLNVDGASGGYTTTVDFGDGTTATVQPYTHTYDSDGYYTVTAKVTDSVGRTAERTIWVLAGPVTDQWDDDGFTIQRNAQPLPRGYCILTGPPINNYRRAAGLLASGEILSLATYDIPISVMKNTPGRYIQTHIAHNGTVRTVEDITSAGLGNITVRYTPWLHHSELSFNGVELNRDTFLKKDDNVFFSNMDMSGTPGESAVYAWKFVLPGPVTVGSDYLWYVDYCSGRDLLWMWDNPDITITVGTSLVVEPDGSISGTIDSNGYDVVLRLPVTFTSNPESIVQLWALRNCADDDARLAWVDEMRPLLSNTSVEKTAIEITFRNDMLACRIDVPDKTIQRAFDWARVHLYAREIWCSHRDGATMSMGAMFAGFRESLVRGYLSREYPRQRNGEAGFADYDVDNTDGIPWGVFLAGNFVKFSQDTAFAALMFPYMKSALEYIETNYTTGGDHLMLKLYRSDTWTDNYLQDMGKTPYGTALYYAACLETADVAEMLGEDADAQTYRDRAAQIKTNANKRVADGGLWNPTSGAYIFYRDHQSDFVEERLFNYNYIATMLGLADADKTDSIINAMRDAGFENGFPASSIINQYPPDSPMISTYISPYYQNGNHWAWPVGYSLAMTLAKRNQQDRAVDILSAIATDVSVIRDGIHEGSRNWDTIAHGMGPGSFVESMYRDTLEADAQLSNWFATSAGMYLWALSEGIFGFSPELNGLKIAPKLPSSWDHATYYHLQYAGADLEIRIIRDDGNNRVIAVSLDGVDQPGWLSDDHALIPGSITGTHIIEVHLSQ